MGMALVASLLLFVAGRAQAFPALDLTPGLPGISSPAQIDVTYSYDADTGLGTLRAFGGATEVNLPPVEAITGGYSL